MRTARSRLVIRVVEQRGVCESPGSEGGDGLFDEGADLAWDRFTAFWPVEGCSQRPQWP